MGQCPNSHLDSTLEVVFFVFVFVFNLGVRVWGKKEVWEGGISEGRPTWGEESGLHDIRVNWKKKKKRERERKCGKDLVTCFIMVVTFI